MYMYMYNFFYIFKVLLFKVLLYMYMYNMYMCVFLEPTFFFHINAFKMLHRKKENNTAPDQIF